MTEELFNALLEEIFEQERAIGKTKGIEYIHQNSYDRLDNFKRIGALFKLDPKVVLGVYDMSGKAHEARLCERL